MFNTIDIVHIELGLFVIMHCRDRKSHVGEEFATLQVSIFVVDVLEGIFMEVSDFVHVKPNTVERNVFSEKG